MGISIEGGWSFGNGVRTIRGAWHSDVSPSRGSQLLNALELKVPPVALVCLFAALMWFTSAYSPLAVALPWRVAIAVMFCGVGLAISLAGVLAFRRANTTVNPITPEATTVMVTSGIYRFSRNPMYLGFLFVLIGWAAFLSHMLAFALLPTFVAYMNRFQIVPEERALAAKFGGRFAEYARVVRRWL